MFLLPAGTRSGQDMSAGPLGNCGCRALNGEQNKICGRCGDAL
jgi:hypothetical protein